MRGIMKRCSSAMNVPEVLHAAARNPKLSTVVATSLENDPCGYESVEIAVPVSCSSQSRDSVKSANSSDSESVDM